jgi:hypothetical protein
VSPDAGRDAERDASQDAEPPRDAGDDRLPTEDSGPDVTTQCPMGLVTLVPGGFCHLYPGIVVDEENVYWSCGRPGGGSALRRVPKCGGAPTTMVTGGQRAGGSGPLAVSATNVYWVSDYGAALAVATTNKVGGTPSTLASGISVGGGDIIVGTLGLDGASVYLATAYSSGPVMSVPLGGGAPETLASLATEQPSGYVAVDSTSVYWTSWCVGCPMGGAGEVLKVGLAGGTPVTLASSTSTSVADVAVDATSVYWLGGDGTVMKVPTVGGTATTLASDVAGRGMAIDAVNVYYWASPSSDSMAVMKVPLGGGAPVTVVSVPSRQGGPSLAVDATSVYWPSSFGPQAIMKFSPK